MGVRGGEEGTSRAIRGHQGPSRAIKGDQGPSRAIKGHQGPSRAIKGHQGPSRTIKERKSERLRRESMVPRVSSSAARRSVRLKWLNGVVIDAGSCDDGPHQRHIIIKALSKEHIHGVQSRRNQGAIKAQSRRYQRDTATECNQGAIKAQPRRNHLLENVLGFEALGDHKLCEVTHDLR